MDNLEINGISFNAALIPLPTSAVLVISGKHGILGCGYLSVETADKLGHALAVVTGVKSYDDMLAAKVAKISSAAAAIGVTTEMTGKQALLLMEEKLR